MSVVKEGSMGHSSEVPHTALPGKFPHGAKKEGGFGIFFGGEYGANRPISPSLEVDMGQPPAWSKEGKGGNSFQNEGQFRMEQRRGGEVTLQAF